MSLAIAFVLGVLVGVFIYWLILRMQRTDGAAVARALLEQTQATKTREVELLISGVKDSVRAETSTVFAEQVKALNESGERLLAKRTEESEKSLISKKELIDQTLSTMADKLEKVTTLVGELRVERASQSSALNNQLTRAFEQTDRLQATTQDLRKVLASPTARGQWGDRMADDVLRLAGFIEGINYHKQTSAAGSTSRPDYTFILPQQLKVNMDVKFPYNSYLAYVESTVDTERDAHRQQFVRDVRNRVKEVTARDYINSEDGTLGYVLLFIPNEGIYSFIHECDRTILDEALQARVIVCSPFTLFAVLAVIRQAIDNFKLESTSAKMLGLMGGFNKQWSAFVQSFNKLGDRIASVQKEYDALTTTRTNQLDRQLQKIDLLRLGEAVAIDGSTELAALSEATPEEPDPLE